MDSKPEINIATTAIIQQEQQQQRCTSIEKPVETLVVNNNISMRNNNKSSIKNPLRKEDEKITTAVMKVLEGYDWTLVPATTK